MDRPSHTLLRLDIETHAYHRDADHAWLALRTNQLTRADYASQLARAYRFEAPLEAALAYTPHITSIIPTRARSPLLIHDLAALDYPQTKLAPRLIAPFPSIAQALGWLYVLERSARLFDLVRRNVLARIPDAPTTYLDDAQALTRWNALGDVLDRVARTPRVRDQIIHAAHDAFRTALDRQPAPPQSVRRGA